MSKNTAKQRYTQLKEWLTTNGVSTLKKTGKYVSNKSRLDNYKDQRVQ